MAWLTRLHSPTGRSLGYAECGDPGGIPVVYLHGAPGSRLEAGPESPFADLLAEAGVRYVGMERAGSGVSTARAGRQMREQAEDVEAFVDRLGLQRFALIGWSSGGPVALAATARLSDRVSALGLIASVAPMDRTGLGTGEQAFLDLARTDAEALRLQMNELAAAMRDDPATTSLSPPVRLVHGTDDRIVPIEHSRYLTSALPNSSLTEYEGDGHISVLAHLIDVCEQLIVA